MASQKTPGHAFGRRTLVPKVIPRCKLVPVNHVPDTKHRLQQFVSPRNPRLRSPHSLSRQNVILLHHPFTNRYADFQHRFWYLERRRRWHCPIPFPRHCAVHEPIYHPLQSGHCRRSTVDQWWNVSFSSCMG